MEDQKGVGGLMAARDWTHEVPADELQVGDRIIDFNLGSRWHVEQYPDAAERVRRWVVGQLKASQDRIEIIGTDGEDIHNWRPGDLTRFRVVRGAQATATSTGCWNGTCAACGRGTYTGLLSVEHEGGGCRAG